MQKISSYLYPNRIEVLIDVASFNVEYTNVYQRNVKIYNGIDNTIEFDIKNADQKRLDLAAFDLLQLNVMDAAGNELPNSPYELTTNLATRGIATVVIPASDLEELDPQYLRYSMSGLQGVTPVLFYCNSRFGAVGTIELVGSAMPIVRKDRVYDIFTAEIDLKGQPIYHTSAIPAKFYEAIVTDTLDFEIHVQGFIGSIWIDATKNSTINAEAFKAAGKPFGSWTRTIDDGEFTGIVPFGSNISVSEYNYFRVSYECPISNGVGSAFTVTRENATYHVTVKSGGTGYAIGAQIKVPGDQLGGTNGIHDLIITVTHVDSSSAGYTSSYAVSGISGVTWSGLAESGTGTYIVSGTNISGTLDKVIVS